MLGIIVVSTIIPVVTFLAGLERVGPTNAAMLSTIEPVVTVLLAAWLFGDKLLPIVMVGGGLILVSGHFVDTGGTKQRRIIDNQIKPKMNRDAKRRQKS